MKKVYLATWFTLSMLYASYAQVVGDYRVTFEVVEVCGFGNSDDNDEENRWQVYGKLEDDADWRGGGIMGFDNAKPGDCFSIDRNTNVGLRLPYKFLEFEKNFTEESEFTVNLWIRGYEKDCRSDNSKNGDDLRYKSSCFCGNAGIACPEKDDDDFREVGVDGDLFRTFKLSDDVGTGIWSIEADMLGDKWSLQIKYTITPPVMTAPVFIYPEEFLSGNVQPGVQTTCSEANFYMVWHPGDYPTANIDEVIWYENLDGERQIIGYEDIIDPQCVAEVQLECDFCNFENPLEPDLCLDICNEDRCVVGSTPIYGGFRWTEVGRSDVPWNGESYYAFEDFAPLVTSEFQTVRYAVKAVTAQGVMNIGFGDPSAAIDVFPPPPTINGLPADNTDDVLDPDEEDLFLSDNFEIQHVQCREAETGSIRIKKIDDPREFYYTLRPLDLQRGGGNPEPNPSPSPSNPVVYNGLGAGRFELRIEIQDSNGNVGCFSIDTIMIKQPAAVPTATSDTKEYEGGFEVSCHDATDGEITILAQGGIPPYRYTLTGSNGYAETQEDNPVFVGLAPLDNAGNPVTYTYEVWDRYDCYFEGIEEIVLSVPEPVQFAAVEPLNRYANPDNPDEFYDIRCHGGTDSLVFTLAGGAGPYELFMDGEFVVATAGESQQAIIGGLLGATDYEVTMRDANGCETATTVHLTQPDPVILADYHVIPAACFGSATASLGLKAGQGIPYSGRSYLYTIRHLAVPADLDFPFDAEQSITVPTDSAVFPNLIGGPYEVTMEDYYGCIGVDTVFVPEPDRLSTSVSSTGLQCKGDTNGTAITVIEGGTAPFTITWANEFKVPFETVTVNAGEPTSVEGLAGGLYYVFVEDANGCQFPRSGTPFTIQEPPLALDLFFGSLENASCFGSADGSVTLQATGGWRNVPYKFGTDKTSLTFNANVYSQLAPGSYEFFVEDGQGCTDSVEVFIEEPETLQVQLVRQTAIRCHGEADGGFELAATGGVPPYRYSLDNGLSWSAEGRFDGLPSGDYTVLVEDANATCPLVKIVPVVAPTPLIVMETNNTGTACGTAAGSAAVQVVGGTAPYRYAWQDLSGTPLGTTAGLENLAAGRYQVTVTDANDCQTLKDITISNPEGPEVRIDAVTSVSCAGGRDGAAQVAIVAATGPATVRWSNGQEGPQASGLSAGAYIAEVRDAAGCLTFVEVLVPEPAPLAVAYQTTLPTCHGDCDGEIALDVTGGNGGYTYQWADGGVGATQGNLCAGEHNVTITDSQGCTTTLTVLLEEPAPVEPDLEEALTVCEGQQHTLDAGYPGGSYIWTSDVGFTAATQAVTIDQAGTYRVEVTDSNGCTGSGTFTLDISNDLLEAEFLVLTEAIAGDTVVLVNITYPEPAVSRWTLPEEVTVLNAFGYHQQVIFPEEGSYPVTLHTELANCQAEMTKQVLVTSAAGEVAETVFGYQGETVEEFRVFPNPTTGRFTASVVLNGPKDVRLRLIDVQGQRDLGDFTGTGEASYDVEYEFNDLVEGVYFLLLEVDGATQTLRVLIN